MKVEDPLGNSSGLFIRSRYLFIICHEGVHSRSLEMRSFLLSSNELQEVPIAAARPGCAVLPYVFSQQPVEALCRAVPREAAKPLGRCGLAPRCRSSACPRQSLPPLLLLLLQPTGVLG